MNPDLEMLMMLQDLDLMIRDLQDGSDATREKELGFNMEKQDALETARRDLATKMGPELIGQYDKLHERYRRAIVPVKNNVCLACFLKQPTQYSTEMMSEIKTCDHCSRILYLL